MAFDEFRRQVMDGPPGEFLSEILPKHPPESHDQALADGGRFVADGRDETLKLACLVDSERGLLDMRSR
jgi:hypothetical protein